MMLESFSIKVSVWGRSFRLVVIKIADEIFDRVLRKKLLNSAYNCAANVLLWDMIRVGRLILAITLATVCVLPDPVTPSTLGGLDPLEDLESGS